MAFGLRSDNPGDRTWRRVAIISSILASLTVVARYGGDCAATYLKPPESCRKEQPYTTHADYRTEAGSTGLGGRSRSIFPPYETLDLPAPVKRIGNIVRYGVQILDSTGKTEETEKKTADIPASAQESLDRIVSPQKKLNDPKKDSVEEILPLDLTSAFYFR